MHNPRGLSVPPAVHGWLWAAIEIASSIVSSHCAILWQVIRAYGGEAAMQAEFEAKLNQNIEAYFSFVAAARWFGFRLDMLNMSFVACTVVGALLLQVRVYRTNAEHCFNHSFNAPCSSDFSEFEFAAEAEPAV